MSAGAELLWLIIMWALGIVSGVALGASIWRK